MNQNRKLEVKNLNRNRKFEVRNLGVIESGSFEVKPLTLFCGRNNSAKTWAMYSLYNFYSLLPYELIPRGIIKTIREQGVYKFNLFGKHKYKEVIDRINRQVSKSLPELFNSSSASIKDASFELSIEGVDWWASNLRAEEQQETYTDKKGKVRLSKPKGSEYIDISVQRSNKDDLMFYLADFIRSCLFPDIGDVFLMPAERNGLHLFFRELSNRRVALLHHASKKDIDIHELLRDVMRSRYAIPIADYIDWLNELVEMKKAGRGKFHGFAEKLKKGLVRGAYSVDAMTGEITFKPYQIKRGKKTDSLGLHVASGTVKSLFGLWFYLEYQAKEGDILMIDEPELNVHPENQRKLARFFASLVNAGLNVVMSTHSDYIVREFNSLIMLSRDTDKKLQKQHGYSENEVLRLEQVGAYHFDKEKQKIEASKITPDGIHAITFDDVIRDLNRVNNGIYYSLQESEDE